jgi:regulation of enolase protein 1 (concanavalin A-like superfamily)
MLSLRQLMSNNQEISDWSIVPISKISDDLPAEFQEINIADVLDGCTDNLGAFSKQHLTMTFITKMGLWFTKSEENELKGPNNSNTERLKMAKERLHLPSKLVLRLSEKGLSYHEMRAMLTLPKKQKYSDMTTEQLLTLRNKVLLRLSREVDSHIFSWNRLKRQIEMVAKSKGINLND